MISVQRRSQLMQTTCSLGECLAKRPSTMSMSCLFKLSLSSYVLESGFGALRRILPRLRERTVVGNFPPYSRMPIGRGVAGAGRRGYWRSRVTGRPRTRSPPSESGGQSDRRPRPDFPPLRGRIPTATSEQCIAASQDQGPRRRCEFVSKEGIQGCGGQAQRRGQTQGLAREGDVRKKSGER